MGDKKKKSKKKDSKAGITTPLHSNEVVIKKLSGKDYLTAVQLAEELGITKTTAQVYLKRIAKSRTFETSMVRQGLRGPKAIGFRLRAR